MGKMSIRDRCRQWVAEEFNVEAFMDRLLQPDTIVGLIGAATSFGILQWTEVQASSVAYFLTTIGALYLAGRNKKKAIRKAAEEMYAAPLTKDSL